VLPVFSVSTLRSYNPALQLVELCEIGIERVSSKHNGNDEQKLLTNAELLWTTSAALVANQPESILVCCCRYLDICSAYRIRSSAPEGHRCRTRPGFCRSPRQLPETCQPAWSRSRTPDPASDTAMETDTRAGRDWVFPRTSRGSRVFPAGRSAAGTAARSRRTRGTGVPPASTRRTSGPVRAPRPSRVPPSGGPTRSSLRTPYRRPSPTLCVHIHTSSWPSEFFSSGFYPRNLKSKSGASWPPTYGFKFLPPFQLLSLSVFPSIRPFSIPIFLPTPLFNALSHSPPRVDRGWKKEK